MLRIDNQLDAAGVVLNGEVFAAPDTGPVDGSEHTKDAGISGQERESLTHGGEEAVNQAMSGVPSRVAVPMIASRSNWLPAVRPPMSSWKMPDDVWM